MEGLTTIVKNTRQVHHNQAYICKSELATKEQGCQQIDRNIHFPFMFDTEPEVLQFLSHCSQLTAAASVKDNRKQLEDNIKSRPAEVQSQASSVSQTVQNVAQSSTQNIILQIQMAQERTQQYANTLNVTYQQAQACLNQHAQQYAAIANASRK